MRWVALCSAAAILFGIIAEMRLTFRPMTLFDLLVILTLVVGGLGLLLRAHAADRRDATGQKSIDAEIHARLEARTPQDALSRLKALDNVKER
jgi:hypothetical protein